MARLTVPQAGGASVLLFLDLIAYSEGTSTIEASDDGYNVLYGGGLFTGYQDHPRLRLTFPLNGRAVTSSAAGRYQLLERYWDAYRRSLRLEGGFTPENQARFATQEEADARARQILSQFPTSQVFTAQVLKEYSAKVTVTAKDPAEPPPEPEATAA